MFLRAGLSAFLEGPQAADSLQELQSARPAFARFLDPTAIVAEIAAQQAPRRNDLVVELISVWRHARALRHVTGAVLTLGLWKDLNLVYQYEAQFWVSILEEFEALFVFHFLRAINSSRVERAPDAGQSLVRAARRDATRALVRTRELQARDLRFGHLLLNTASGALVPLNEFSERDLRSTLTRLMRREDIDLLVEVFVNDRSREWLVERFHKSRTQINFRVYRLLGRRRRLA
jgi:hypothetical protein